MDWCTAGVDLLCPRKSPSLKGVRSFIDNKIRVYPPPEVPYRGPYTKRQKSYASKLRQNGQTGVSGVYG